MCEWGSECKQSITTQTTSVLRLTVSLPHTHTHTHTHSPLILSPPYTRSLPPSLPHSLTHSLTRTFTYSLTFTYSHIHLLAHSLTHIFYSHIHSLPPSLTHSPEGPAPQLHAALAPPAVVLSLEAARRVRLQHLLRRRHSLSH